MVHKELLHLFGSLWQQVLLMKPQLRRTFNSLNRNWCDGFSNISLREICFALRKFSSSSTMVLATADGCSSCIPNRSTLCICFQAWLDVCLCLSASILYPGFIYVSILYSYQQAKSGPWSFSTRVRLSREKRGQHCFSSNHTLCSVSLPRQELSISIVFLFTIN